MLHRGKCQTALSGKPCSVMPRSRAIQAQIRWKTGIMFHKKAAARVDLRP